MRIRKRYGDLGIYFMSPKDSIDSSIDSNPICNIYSLLAQTGEMMYFNKMMALVMIGLLATVGLAGCVGNDDSDLSLIHI